MKRQPRKNKFKELRKKAEILRALKKNPASHVSQAFWDEEYREGGHLALSDTPSEDLAKFTRWLEREYGKVYLNPTTSVLDLGCGNGRNIIALAETYGMHGIGFDISKEAVAQATRKSQSKNLQLKFEARSIGEALPVPDNSQTLVLDMMTSHFLNSEQRNVLHQEITRVLKPGGWLFFKTFLLDEDRHARRLLRDNPAQEQGSYIHPEIGVAEHVFTEEEIIELLSDRFKIHKINKSHRHIQNGRAFKRRSISIFAQKIG